MTGAMNAPAWLTQREGDAAPRHDPPIGFPDSPAAVLQVVEVDAHVPNVGHLERVVGVRPSGGVETAHHDRLSTEVERAKPGGEAACLTNPHHHTPSTAQDRLPPGPQTAPVTWPAWLGSRAAGWTRVREVGGTLAAPQIERSSCQVRREHRWAQISPPHTGDLLSQLDYGTRGHPGQK